MILSVAVLAGGPLLFYVFTCPSFTQASDAMLVAVAFFLVVTPVSSIPRARLRNVLLGFVLALSVLLRNNNVVLVPILAGAQILLLKRQGIHRTLWSGIEVFLGALPVLLVHIWFNLDQYGGMVATGYGLKRSVTFLHRIQNLQSLFFHPIAGIFTNHPVTILAVVGWILGMRQRRPEAFVAAACAFTVILSLAYVGFIFPGSAFGQRILAHLYIFFLVGVYLFLQSFRVSGTILTILFVLWSFVSMNLYFVVTSQKEFRTNDRRGFDPFVMAVGAVQACRITGSSPAELWYESLTTGPYPTLHSILKKKAE